MNARPALDRSAGFQTCRIADFQIGRPSNRPPASGLETCDTADLEVCATALGPARCELTRRDFIRGAALCAVVGGLAAAESSATGAAPKTQAKPAGRGLIDTNVTLGRWPFRRVPLDDTPALAAKLRQHGVTQAWAGTFDGVFHKDLDAANARLAAECRKHGRGMLLPFGSVNPMLPDWEDDLQRCAGRHKMPGIRLHPNYHGYTLDDPVFAKLLSLATEHNLVVQIVADMEDERTQPPLARVPHTDCPPLTTALQSLPGARVVLLNWFRSVKTALVKQLGTAGVCFDIATLEGVGGVANLLDQIPADRVLFGSHAPLFYFESAVLKLKESALPAERERAVCSGNAERLLRRL